MEAAAFGSPTPLDPAEQEGRPAAPAGIPKKGMTVTSGDEKEGPEPLFNDKNEEDGIGAAGLLVAVSVVAVVAALLIGL